MGGLQQFLGLSSFKKKENVQVLVNDEIVSQNELVVYKDDKEKESVMIDEIDPRKKNIPLSLMKTDYAYLTSNQFTCFNYANMFFTFQAKTDEISFGKVPFETIKIKDTSEVKDFLFKEVDDEFHYFRFIRDKDTHNVFIILYAQDKIDKDKIVVATVVQMDLKSFGIDNMKRGLGRMDEVLCNVIKNMADCYISISEEEKLRLRVFKELYLFLGFSVEYEI